MIGRDDLRAAVAAGVVTEAQAIRLASLADERRGVRTAMGPSDEPFELFQGLNEIFIVTGLVILYGGWAALTGLAVLGVAGDGGATAAVYALIMLAVTAVLARYFTLKRRMTAPSIALAIFFGLGLLQLGYGLADTSKLAWNHEFLLTAGLAFAGLTAYWAVFRVPFTFALMGVALLSLLFSISLLNGAAVFDLRNAFLLTAEGPFALVTVATGLAALALALRYDFSDPHRVTRRSANAFWLHVVAAPAIVNTVAQTLIEEDTAGANLLLLGFLLVIAVFAIVIDRRSFLMAGAGYAVALSALVLEDGSPMVILLLGVALIFLGAKWEAIRGRTLSALPNFPGKDRLPPWTAPSDKADT